MNEEMSNSSTNRASNTIAVAIIGAIGLILAATVPPLLNTSKEAAVAAREIMVAETQTAIAPELTQVAQIINATPTIVPRFIERISVPSTTNMGIVYSARQRGIYTFQYATGAYATWRLEDNGPEGRWASLVVAFPGNEPPWEREDLRDDLSLFHIGGTGGYSSEDEATVAAIGDKASVELQANQQITLIVPDGRFDFDDNTGEIVLDVYFVPNP